MNLKGPRLARARQLFYWCLVNKQSIKDPVDFEAEFNSCVDAVRDAAERDDQEVRAAS